VLDTITGTDSFITGDSPGFVAESEEEFRPQSGSPVVDAAVDLPSRFLKSMRSRWNIKSIGKRSTE